MMLYIARSVISSKSSEKMMAPSPFHTNLRRHGFKLEENSSSPNCNQAKRQDDNLPYIYPIAEPILRAKCRALTHFISQQDGTKKYVLFPVDHNSTRHPNRGHEKRSQGHPNTRYLPPALSAADMRHLV
jgi:hypothetical protein